MYNITMKFPEQSSKPRWRRPRRRRRTMPRPRKPRPRLRRPSPRTTTMTTMPKTETKRSLGNLNRGKDQRTCHRICLSRCLYCIYISIHVKHVFSFDCWCFWCHILIVEDRDLNVFGIHGYDFPWSAGVEHFAEVWLGTKVCHSRWTFTACTGQESCASAAILMAGQGQTVTWRWQKDQLRNAAISSKLACDRKSGENAILGETALGAQTYQHKVWIQHSYLLHLVR